MKKRSRGVRNKKTSKAIIAPDVVFATLVQEQQVKVIAQDGIVMLQSTTTGKIYSLPAGIYLPAESHGQLCNVIVRTITDEVLLDVEENDIFEQDLGKKGNENIMPVDNWKEILTLMDECKIKYVSNAFASIGTGIAGLVLFVVSLLMLLKTDFYFVYLLYAGIICGLLAAVFGGCLRCFHMFSKADSNILADSCGNYIDFDTGETNLNRGMIIPIKE